MNDEYDTDGFGRIMRWAWFPIAMLIALGLGIMSQRLEDARRDNAVLRAKLTCHAEVGK